MKQSFTGNALFSNLLIGCLILSSLSAHSQMVLAPPAAKMVAEAKQQITLIDMAGLKAAVDNKDTGLLLDVRLPAEQAASGRVPGALSMPRGTVEFAIWPKVGYPDKTDFGQKITVYCGTSWRSALAAKSLKDLGFTNVRAVDMRMADWLAAGYPVEK
jgi:rhodanese-related sulfurtransferase